jgi:hypothetical protein
MISDLCGGTIAAFMTDATITCLAATSDGSIIVAGDTVGKVHMLIFEEP